MFISKLQHASGLFKNLGSKKLLLLEHLYESNNVTIENITSIEGFSDISAKSYLDSIDVFKSFVNDIGSLLTIIKTEVKEVSTDGGLDGQTYLFTGVRRKDLEELLTDKSANVSKTMSKKITHLVCKKHYLQVFQLILQQLKCLMNYQMTQLLHLMMEASGKVVIHLTLHMKVKLIMRQMRKKLRLL